MVWGAGEEGSGDSAWIDRDSVVGGRNTAPGTGLSYCVASENSSIMVEQSSRTPEPSTSRPSFYMPAYAIL